MIPGLTPGEIMRMHEERVQQILDDMEPFRFHRPIVRLARAVAVSAGGAIGRIRRAQVGAEGRLGSGQANVAADEVVGLAK
ncbi:MAG TPA: hypothetical protein VH482_17570 [Thermomicrobiales bacterium]|jgi:hypothetical protein